METAIKTTQIEVNDPWVIIKNLHCSIESKDHQIKLLEERVQYLLHYRFGSKSEQLNDKQGSLFDDTEVPVEENTEEEIEVPSHKRKKGGRRKPPKDLERIRIEHSLTEQQQQCDCCGDLLQIKGEEITERYNVEPARFWIEEHVRLTYGGCHCNKPLVTAPYDPPPPLPRTQASAGMLAWIGTSKFVDGLPANRIASIMEKRFGIPFTSTTLADWMIKAAERLITPLLAAFEQVIHEADYLHVDETTLQVLLEPNRTAKQKSYIWSRVTGSGIPVVLMSYSPSRAGAVASELLKNFRGYLQTDGYAGYGATAQREDIIQLGCWAHVRRKFDAAAKSSAPGAANIARQAMKLIGKLYHLDNQGKERPPDERTRYRQQVVSPKLRELRQWLDSHMGQALSYGGLLSTAFIYIHNQWPKLIVFVQDGRLSMDNNKAERHFRPIAVGRRTWLFAKSERGAHATAAWHSLVETAKANGLEPYWYLKMLFEAIPSYLRDEKPLDDLLPWNVDPEQIMPSLRGG